MSLDESIANDPKLQTRLLLGGRETTLNPFPTRENQEVRRRFLEKYRPFKEVARQIKNTVPDKEPETEPSPQQDERHLSISSIPARADYDPFYQARYIFPEDGPDKDKTKHAGPRTLKDQLEEIFDRDHLSLEDLTPYRIRVAYRICLHLATLTGSIQHGESLGQAMTVVTYDDKDNIVDPWTMPRALPRQFEVIEENHSHGKLSIYPQDPPTRWTWRGGIDPAYNPNNKNHDPSLHMWVAAAHWCYSMLGIAHGSPSLPLYGKMGMQGLTDPKIVREAMPTPGEIMAFENVLLHDTLESLFQEGAMRTVLLLEKHYGLTKQECQQIMNMARSQAPDIASTDVDQEKILMIMRLQDIARRAKESLDTRSEINAMKLLAQVIGITRAEPQDFKTEATAFIREWTAAATKKKIKKVLNGITRDENHRAPVPEHIKLPPPPEGMPLKPA